MLQLSFYCSNEQGLFCWLSNTPLKVVHVLLQLIICKLIYCHVPKKKFKGISAGQVQLNLTQTIFIVCAVVREPKMYSTIHHDIIADWYRKGFRFISLQYSLKINLGTLEVHCRLFSLDLHPTFSYFHCSKILLSQ